MAHAVGAAARPDDPPHLKVAFSRLGLKEVAGARDNPAIVDMFARIGRSDIHDDETSWCAAFVGWCLVQAGVPLSALPPKSQRLLARAYLKFGRKLVAPARGAIVVFERGSSSWQGHVAFFLRFVAIGAVTYVEVIGGNQANAVTIARYPVSKVLGYRTPVAAAPAEARPAEALVPDPPKGAIAKAAAGSAVLVGTGGAMAVAGGVPWCAVLAGVALGLLGAGALIFSMRRKG